jgi:hypothetical protein
MKIELPITFVIENTSPEKANAVLMGYHKNFLSNNFGSDSGVKVTIDDPDLTHADVMEHVLTESTMITVESENEDQISEVIGVNCEDPESGQSVSLPIITQSYIPPKEDGDEPRTKLEFPFHLKLDKKTWLNVPVATKTKVKITFS